MTGTHACIRAKMPDALVFKENTRASFNAVFHALKGYTIVAFGLAATSEVMLKQLRSSGHNLPRVYPPHHSARCLGLISYIHVDGIPGWKTRFCDNSHSLKYTSRVVVHPAFHIHPPKNLVQLGDDWDDCSSEHTSGSSKDFAQLRIKVPHLALGGVRQVREG